MLVLGLDAFFLGTEVHVWMNKVRKKTSIFNEESQNKDSSS